MSGETSLQQLLKTLQPILNAGEYVFCVVDELSLINQQDILFFFKEQEGITIVLQKEKAASYHLSYSFIASWITLTIHSSLEAVGLTAAFSTALSNEGISCNVVAAFYHDHIFVDKKHAESAMMILHRFSTSV